MLSHHFLLGLAAMFFAIVNGDSVDSSTLPQNAIIPNQALLNAIDGNALPPEPKTMTSGGVLRSYRTVVPSDYDQSREWPLIIDFHGRHGSALRQWNNSQFYLNPSGKEYIVAYPNGCLGAGNDGGSPERAWQGAPYANASCDDLLFVRDLVHHLKLSYNINSRRIFASGKSNGGGFVDTLACSSTGDIFAAFAMASAALYTDTLAPGSYCKGQRPRMILESHGTEDHIIPINGRKNGEVPNIARWSRRWAVRNGCDPDADGDMVETDWGWNTTYSCSGPTNSVQQYNVTGLGHCWPSLTNNTDTMDRDCDVQTLDFTQAVMDFFKL